VKPGKSLLALTLAAIVSPPAFTQDAPTAEPYPDLVLLPEGEAPADQIPAEAVRRRGPVVEEIVVTAQKREESINEVSISISAFTGEDLADLGVTDTRDMSNLIPGFRYAESGYNTPIYSLRGVGFNEASQTASATVGVYVDEINLPFPIMSKGANLDLERVEVLKGPQGTLYGRNTTGGAINYIARKPTGFFETGFTASYGRFQTSDIEGYVSGPVSENLSARLALRDIRSQQGWQQSLTRDAALGELDKQSARLILDWAAGDTLNVSLTATAWRDHSEPQAPQAIGLSAQNALLGDLYESLGLDRNLALSPSVRNHPLVSRESEDPRIADWTSDLGFQLRDSFYSGTARADWDLSGDLQLTWLGTYQKFRSDGSMIPQSGLSISAGDREAFVDTTAHSTELRLSGLWREDVDWLVGVFYSGDDVDELQDLYLGDLSTGFPTPLNPVIDELEALLGLDLPLVGNLVVDRAILEGQQSARSAAVFANAGWQLVDAFRLNFGLRYTDETRRFRGCSRDSPDNSEGIGLTPVFTALSLLRGGSGQVSADGCFSLDENGNPGAYTGSLREDNLSGRIALDWTPTDDLLLFASYSRGFKSGSFPVLTASDQQQYEPVTQEKLDAFEIGAKATMWDGRIQFNPSVFHYGYKDKQLLGNILDPVFGPLPLLVNAPEARITGAEFDLQVNPIDGLFVSLAASWLDTEIQKFVGIDKDGETRDFAGNRFNFSPELEYTALVNYVFPLGTDHDGLVGVDYSYTGTTNSSLGGEPEFVHEDYFVLNARAAISSADGRWKVGVWGRNLTDELSTVSIQKIHDTFARYVGMTRTYGVSLSWNLN
jgi:iron complex outermembrane receptor protein